MTDRLHIIAVLHEMGATAIPTLDEPLSGARAKECRVRKQQLTLRTGKVNNKIGKTIDPSVIGMNTIVVKKSQ